MNKSDHFSYNTFEIKNGILLLSIKMFNKGLFYIFYKIILKIWIIFFKKHMNYKPIFFISL